jgi:signal transduction histidine kinase
MLAAMFVVATRVDVTQKYPVATDQLLIVYVAVAVALLAATWRNWWWDATLAGPAHAIDIGVFTALVFLTEGYTSPFFPMFIFVLLAAAIRWGWQETALTAILLTLLYVLAGMAARNADPGFIGDRFIIRASQLIIVSLILIWFGSTRWVSRAISRADALLAETTSDQSPLETIVGVAVQGTAARRGVILWKADGGQVSLAFDRSGSGAAVPTAATWSSLPAEPFLYDLARKRGLTRDAERNLKRVWPQGVIGHAEAATLQLREGVAIPLRAESGDGLLFIEQPASLSTDYLELGKQVAAAATALIQRHALLRAAEESAEGRSRMALARDLHDSVVQFLAGAAFRLEAMRRAEASGSKVEPDLDELKKLMLQEQAELRAFISALRSGSEVDLRDLVADLRSLSERLSKQWAVECDFEAETADGVIPTRLHLDAHQLVREAVANAVRHASAKSVRITLLADATQLRMHFVNDGAPFPMYGERLDPPASLQERVEQAGGTIELSRGMNVTKVSIALPIARRSV